MKAASVKQNVWGNWNAYLGRKKVQEFGTASDDARKWQRFFDIAHSVDDLLLKVNRKSLLTPTNLNWLEVPFWGLMPKFFELGSLASIDIAMSIFSHRTSSLGVLAKRLDSCEYVMLPLYSMFKDGLVLNMANLETLNAVPDLVMVMEAWRRRKSLDSTFS